MAFGGLMQKTGQIEALIAPLVSRVRSRGGLTALTAVSCICMNVILPDQYLAISVPGQMYAEEYDRRGMSRVDLSARCSAAVRSRRRLFRGTPAASTAPAFSGSTPCIISPMRFWASFCRCCSSH